MRLNEFRKKNLLGRDGLEAGERRDNEFAARKQLNDFLEFVPDANLILDNLPADQLKKSSKLSPRLNNLTLIEELQKLIEGLARLMPEDVDLRPAAVSSMRLTEALIKQTSPAEWEFVDKEHPGRSPAITTRHFTVKLSDSLPGLSESIASITATYEPSANEIEYIRHVRAHCNRIKDLMRDANKDPQVYSPQEFNASILPRLKTLKNFKTNTVLIGTPKDDISKEEALEQFETAEKMIRGE
jgi:hypothetical protein